MHELSIAAYLLAAVEQQAQQAGATRVVAINLVIGERAGVVDDSLRFSFDMLAENARIVTRQVLMRFRCAECADNYTPSAGDFRCPRCGAIGQVADDASALLIESIEIET